MFCTIPKEATAANGNKTGLNVTESRGGRFDVEVSGPVEQLGLREKG